MDIAVMDEGWRQALGPELAAPGLADLADFLRQRAAQGATIYPARQNWFRAFALTPLAQVRVVILGQDPYHGPGQAHGLAFSVNEGVAIPPSLLNIFKEIEADLGLPRPDHGCLESWARQGVLLLNDVLTVEAGCPGAHEGRGWEALSEAAIRGLNQSAAPVVFMLWGKSAGKKAAVIDAGRHLVLKAPHPSPLSAHRGFLGCRHFSQANDWLEAHGRGRIDWQLPQRMDRLI